MPRITDLAPLALGVACWLSAAPAAAECKDLKQFLKDETAGAEKFVDMFTFRRDHRGDSVLMFVKDSVERGRLPGRWLFLHREAEGGTDYCVRGRGEEIGHRENDAASAAAETFGPPGSGLPRCATSTAKARAADLLRDWAVREMGKSIVLTTASPDASGFQFVISDDQNWIIIEDQNQPPQTSCFFDRGTDVFMRFNITVLNP
jgi:hypothetical protein